MLHVTFHICVLIIVCLRNSVMLEGPSTQPSEVFKSVSYWSENAHVQLALPNRCFRLALESLSVSLEDAKQAYTSQTYGRILTFPL
jgi:hypothetical protein